MVSNGSNQFGPKIDRDALHQLLWERTDSFGRIKFEQKKLAEELGRQRNNLNRIIKEMKADGRLKVIKKFKSGIGVYHVMDPQKWKEEREA